ncbi:hypothetical protein, partial [Candidatus Ichthyocystis hellenicum]|uniref:hypothetical protein n=1 Tax=Candidatus Ichthyocystis hellenicum TaxID=1561003 RepID=UPI000A807FFF
MRGRKLQHGFTFPISESESESEPEPEPESASRHSDQESSLTQEVTSVGSPTSVPILAKSQMSTEVQAKFGTNGSGAESIVASTSETTAVASVSGTSTEAGSALRSSLLNLMERDMLEFNSINEDFIACFEPILCELINNNLLLGIDTGQFDLGSILSNIRPIVYEVKTSYFFEKGFAARIESILSRALIVLPSGSRVMTYAEKVAFIISSMSGVNERIDNFSSDYISALINSDLPTSRDEPAQSSSLGTGEVEEGSKGKGKGKKRKARDEDYDKSNSDLPTSRDESAQSSSLGTGEVEEGSKGKGKGKKRKARDEDYDKSNSDLPTSRDESAQSSSLGTGEVEEGSKGKGKGKKR